MPDGFLVLGCDYGMFLHVLLSFSIIIYNNVAGQLYYISNVDIVIYDTGEVLFLAKVI